ncbi:sugar ABC transporter substrate-binding protein [Synergistales bacterium]|nr:sugar ABC transporter substrate-binding protein [Synergistales bacterium]
MRKLVKIFALFLAVAVGVVGFAGNALAADETYGMVVFLKGSEFFNWCYAGFQDAAATVGAKTELQGPADWDASGEAKAVEQLIAKQVKGIAVTAGDADTLVASINAAIAAKIPTLTFDSDSPKSNRMLFVGTNNYNSGYQAGKALGKALGDKARVGISMIPGLDSITHRIAGFTAGLAEVAPGAKIVAQVNDEGDVVKAETVLTAMLQANPEINAIFCGHGNPGTGAVKATINVGRDKGDNKVNVCAFALDVPILEMVQNDELFATVAQNPYLMGVESFWQLYSAAHPTQFDNPNFHGFGNVPTSDLDTGVNIIFKGDPLIDALLTPPTIK